jgi:hypothetical protein
MGANHAARLREGQVGWPQERVTELSLLLSGPQVGKLERLASSRGLTVGQLIRLVLWNYLRGLNDPDPADQ